MAEGVDTLVTPQMREALDVWSEPSWSLPIEASDIRRWAIATYYPEKPPRLFWDEEYAKTTRWGGIIAPPEFNPFAWQIDTPTGRQFWEADNNLPRPQTPPDPNAPGQHGMNGGQDDVYGVPMRPGDRIAESVRADEVGRAHRPPRADAVHLHEHPLGEPARRAGAPAHLDQHPLLASASPPLPPRSSHKPNPVPSPWGEGGGEGEDPARLRARATQFRARTLPHPRWGVGGIPHNAQALPRGEGTGSLAALAEVPPGAPQERAALV